MAKSNETLGQSSPTSKKRGCMCKNGTYSRKCCDGTLRAHGVGKTRGTSS